MKHFLRRSTGLILVLLTVCTHAQEISKTKADSTNKSNAGMAISMNQGSANMGMQGAYAMLMQMENNGIRDSMMNVQQFKIYTDKYFMYAHALPGDSVAVYGFGTYGAENGNLMEYPFFTSTAGDHKDTFTISITKLGNGYVQVINLPPDSLGRRYVLTEEYGNVSSPVTSPLDGAWKLTKTMTIPKTGATITDDHVTQFKVFQSGHFMWARTAMDSTTHQSVSTFGYGTFEMAGANKAKERTTNSTFKTALVGKPVMVQLKFTGKDTYQQTIDWPTGKSVEVYERLK